MGPRYRLGRPTKLAQRLRNEATPQERKLWSHLRGSRLGGHKFSRQLPIAGFICDFVARRAGLVIEIDGGQHGWRTEEDARRTALIERAGYRVIRFWNNEVDEAIEGVLDAIVREIEAGGPPPTPPASGRGVDTP